MRPSKSNGRARRENLLVSRHTMETEGREEREGRIQTRGSESGWNPILVPSVAFIRPKLTCVSFLGCDTINFDHLSYVVSHILYFISCLRVELHYSLI